MADIIDYTPPLSLADFFYNDEMISLACGPVGSTKTSAGILRIAYMASRMAPCKDGIRRSKCIWVRNTREQLNDTSIPDFLKWFPSGVAGIFQKTGLKFLLKFGDVECLVLFRGLDDANDVRRVLSLQASFAVFDEFREIHPDIFEAVQGRLGRYPDKSMVPHRPEWGLDDMGLPIGGCVDDYGHPMKKVWGMSNPPDLDTYWEHFLTNPPDNAHVTIQPGGMDPTADWLEYLPSNYYTDLAKGKSEDYIDVYIHAKFGKSLAGKAVFRSFSREIHVASGPIAPNPLSTAPVIVGFDCTGLNPAAVIGQAGANGRLYVFDALFADEMGALRFIRERIKPLLASKYSGCKVLTVIDPAGVARQADERNVVDLLRAEGMLTKPARTNGISARIAAVEAYLTRMVDGKSGVVIDPDGCKLLIQALQGKYRYKMNTKGDVADTPDKNHPHSDIADAFQYLCLHADGGTIFGAHVNSRREIKPAPVRWAR